jgi:hypothetical protein
MITRRLNLNDFEQIDELITIRWSQVKKRRPSKHDQILKDRIKNYLQISKDIENLKDISNLGQAIGCFDEKGILISFLTQKFTKARPIHYLGNMTVRPKISNFYNVKFMGLGKCWDMAVNFAESRNYFQWYWVTETKGWNKREQEWFKNSLAFKKYHIFIDSMYHKGEKGLFKYQNDMLGEYGANSTVAIKCAILKPIFLHNIFKKKGYLKNDFVPLQYSNLNE